MQKAKAERSAIRRERRALGWIARAAGANWSYLKRSAWWIFRAVKRHGGDLRILVTLEFVLTN